MIMTSDAFLPDGDPRTLTRHGVGLASPTALPDLDNCSAGEFYAFLTEAMHDADVRARIASSDRHLWTTINKVLALAGELDEERRRTERQAAAANRHALEATRLQALHAQLSRDYTRVCEVAQTADQERVESRLAMRPLLRQLGDALAELDAKDAEIAKRDAEIALLKSFDSASRSVTGMTATRLSAHLAVPAAADSFGAERAWMAVGTDPANETVVVDVPVEGGVR